MIGFSHKDLRRVTDTYSSEIFDIYENINSEFIEVSCNEQEHLKDLDALIPSIKKFRHRTLHLPTDISYKNDKETRIILDEIQKFGKKIDAEIYIVHPDIVEDWEVFDKYKLNWAIENMNRKKSTYKTVKALEIFFKKHGNWKMVLDLNHCYSNDETMALADDFINKFKDKIAEIHLSGYKAGHYPLFKTRQTKIIGFCKRLSVPIVIESKFAKIGDAEKEYNYILKYLNRPLGLKRGTVKLVNNSFKEWGRLFEVEKRLLLKTLKGKIVAIEHVGSTAIPEIQAKPIIDIRLTANLLNDLSIKMFIAPLKKLGYYYMHRFPDRHFFAKGPEENRTHHLSIIKADWKNNGDNSILFRDYLRNNKSAREKYNRLKQRLAKKFADDRASYTKGKENFINEIIRTAQTNLSYRDKNYFNQELFLNRIKTEFPALTWKKSKLLRTGFDHDVIVLDKSLIFRFPKSKKYLNILKNEAAFLSYLKKRIKADVPEQIYLSKDKTFAGYSLINGQELKPSRFKRFPAKEKNEIAKQLADFLTVLHATPKKDIARIGIQTQDSKKDFTDLVRDTKKYIYPKLKPGEIEKIKIFFKELEKSLKNNMQKALVHDDLAWEHLFWDRKTQKLGIIDFSDSAYGDPAIDFKGLWKFGDSFVEQVYGLYEGKKDDEMLHRSRLYLKRIPLYVMRTAATGNVCNFKEGYEKFRKMFN